MIADNIQTLKPKSQLAALPWRRVDDRIEVLLVTSRVSRHWLIPKGWPMKGKRDSEAAAIEAFEEAGVEGRMGTNTIGSYGYAKALLNGTSVNCEVEVFALEVRKERDSWPEQAARERRWLTLTDAAAAAYEPGLATLLRGLKDASFQQLPPRKRAASKHAGKRG